MLQACCPEALRLEEDDEGDDHEEGEQADEGAAAAHDGWCEPEGGHVRPANGNGNGMEELVERMQDLATNKGRWAVSGPRAGIWSKGHSDAQPRSVDCLC